MTPPSERSALHKSWRVPGRKASSSLTSFDFKRAKEGTQQIIDSSTGKFRDEFKQRASDFATMIEQSKEVIEETVNAVAIESINDHSASVLVSTTSRKTNSAGVRTSHACGGSGDRDRRRRTIQDVESRIPAMNDTRDIDTANESAEAVDIDPKATEAPSPAHTKRLRCGRLRMLRDVKPSHDSDPVAANFWRRSDVAVL